MKPMVRRLRRLERMKGNKRCIDFGLLWVKDVTGEELKSKLAMGLPIRMSATYVSLERN
jgi:hypothetical protein